MGNLTQDTLKMRAVILMLSALHVLLVTFTDASYLDYYDNVCEFRGNAHFCNGKCDNHMTWRYECKKLSGCKIPRNLRIIGRRNLYRNFGKDCWTGSKKLCCSGPYHETRK